MEKPDLMATSSRVGEGKRILSQLEHGAKPPPKPPRAAGWTIDGWTISLILLLLVMCSMPWLLRPQKPAAVRHNYSLPSQVPIASHDVEIVPAAGQVASIVNQTPIAAPSESRVVAVSDRQSAPEKTTIRAVAAPRKSVPASAPASAAQLNASGDTDVTLLTALVAHAGAPVSVTPERSRDVVERKDGDNTAQLLARCKELGLIEGMLCRSRICSGRWENDAACAAPSH